MSDNLVACSLRLSAIVQGRYWYQARELALLSHFLNPASICSQHNSMSVLQILTPGTVRDQRTLKQMNWQEAACCRRQN